MLQKFRLEFHYNASAIEDNSLTTGETHFLQHELTASTSLRDYLEGYDETVHDERLLIE